jgi:hypothetical protein
MGRITPYTVAERRLIADMALAGHGPTAIARELGNGRAMNAVAGDPTYIEARRHFLAQQNKTATLSRATPTAFAPTVGIESVRRNSISLARVRGIFEAQA